MMILMLRIWVGVGVLAMVVGGCGPKATRVEYAYRLPAGSTPSVRECALRCEGYTVVPTGVNEPGGSLRGWKARQFVHCLEQCPGVGVVRASCSELELDPGTWCYPVAKMEKDNGMETEELIETWGSFGATILGEAADEGDSEDANGPGGPVQDPASLE